MTGMTAWASLNRVEVKASDVIFISGAVGAVGNVAGQLAKLRGCRVIGSTGSMDKVRFLREECGFDIAFDYKVGPVIEQWKLEAPNGIDIYFSTTSEEKPSKRRFRLCRSMVGSSPVAASQVTLTKSRNLVLPITLT